MASPEKLLAKLFIIYVFIELKLYIQIMQTFYIQIPFLCRVTAGTRHMKGSTVDMQNPNAVPPSPILKPMKKLPKFPTPPHTQPKENVNETSICIQRKILLWTLLLNTLK